MWHPNISWKNMSQVSAGIRSRLTFISNNTCLCPSKESCTCTPPDFWQEKGKPTLRMSHLCLCQNAILLLLFTIAKKSVFQKMCVGTHVTATSVKLGWVAVTLCHPQHYSGMFKICGSFPACPHAACVAGTASDVTDHWPNRDTRCLNMFLSFPCVTKVTSKVKCEHLTFDCWSALIALDQACPNYGPGAVCGLLEVFSSGPPKFEEMIWIVIK